MDLSTASSNVVHRFFLTGVDIWYDIFIYAGAIHVVRMRQTFRHFASLSRHRALWARFLRAFCRVHCIPWVTYKWEKISSEELERSVCGVLRFERAAQGYYHCSLKESKSILQPAPTTSYRAPRSVPPSLNNMKLTPGGRYLVGIDAKAKAICCWDLMSDIQDYVSQPRHPIRPLIASWSTVDVLEVARILTQCSPDDPNTIIVAAWLTTAQDARPDSSRIVILKLGLDPTTASFGFSHVRTTGASPVRSLSWTLDGKYIAMAHRSDLVTVWNWTESQWGVASLQAEEGIEMGGTLSPSMSIIGPDLLAVTHVKEGALATHILGFPEFYNTVEAALENTTPTQIAQVLLSLQLHGTTFTRNWIPTSFGMLSPSAPPALSVHFCIWDLATATRARGISVQVVERPNPSQTRTLPNILIQYGDALELSMFPVLESAPTGQMIATCRLNDTVQIRVIHDRHFTGRGSLPSVDLGTCPGFREVSFVDYWNCGLGEVRLVDGALYLRTLTIETVRP